MLINIKVFIFVAEKYFCPHPAELGQHSALECWETEHPDSICIKGAFRNIKNNFRAGPGCALIQTLILQTPSCFSVLHDEDSD